MCITETLWCDDSEVVKVRKVFRWLLMLLYFVSFVTKLPVPNFWRTQGLQSLLLPYEGDLKSWKQVKESQDNIKRFHLDFLYYNGQNDRTDMRSPTSGGWRGNQRAPVLVRPMVSSGYPKGHTINWSNLLKLTEVRHHRVLWKSSAFNHRVTSSSSAFSLHTVLSNAHWLWHPLWLLNNPRWQYISLRIRLSFQVCKCQVLLFHRDFLRQNFLYPGYLCVYFPSSWR